MKKIGIFFGSSTGVTESVAEIIGDKLAVTSDNIKDISRVDSEELLNYDLLVLGASTWGDGDIQDDWYDALDEIRVLDLSNKQVALFGCGDSASYPDTFCDGVGELYEALQDTGCSFVGFVSISDYEYDSSTAEKEGEFIGLLLDEDNESDKSDDRINNWAEQLKKEVQL